MNSNVTQVEIIWNKWFVTIFELDLTVLSFGGLLYMIYIYITHTHWQFTLTVYCGQSLIISNRWAIFHSYVKLPNGIPTYWIGHTYIYTIIYYIITTMYIYICIYICFCIIRVNHPSALESACYIPFVVSSFSQGYLMNYSHDARIWNMVKSS